MKLKDKFRREFIIPLCWGIFLSIVITAFILFGFLIKKEPGNELFAKLQLLEIDKTQPIIKTSMNIMYKTFQDVIYSLEIFSNYYQYFSEQFFISCIVNQSQSNRSCTLIQDQTNCTCNLIPNQTDCTYNINPNQINITCILTRNQTDCTCNINPNQTNCTFILTRNQTNCILNDNQTNFIDIFSLNTLIIDAPKINNIIKTNSSLQDYGRWFVDNKTKFINDTSELFKKQLYVLTSMIQVFRSVFQVSNDEMDLVYFASKKTKLFYGYPLRNNEIFYEPYHNMNNPSYCKNDNGITPTYYYFPCRSWYEQVVDYNNRKLSNTSIMVTKSYKFSQKQETKNGITVCINFNESEYLSNSTDDSYSLILCRDLNTAKLIKMLDHFNKGLSGYYFILNINNDLPIYYPMNDKHENSLYIQYLEFNLNQTYFIDEFIAFEHILNDLKKHIPYKDKLDNSIVPGLLESNTGSYMKNNMIFNYTIYPIYLFMDTNNTSHPIHVFSLVYVLQNQTIMKYINNFKSSVYPRLSLIIFILIMMGLILILLVNNLIISIADNIIKPIKNLKNLIKGLNNKSDKKKNEYNEDEEEDDEDDHNDNEEEILDVRSEEIDNLFNIFIKLRNALSFTSNHKKINDKSSLINYINAKYTFSEVKNIKGLYLCDSNLGNLVMKCHKYDKAIFHLLDSINYHSDIDEVININEPTNEIKNSIQLEYEEASDKDRSEAKFLLNNSGENKTLFLGRFPKLISSYKKFFKSLNKLKNSDQFYNDVAKVDIFAMKDRHTLDDYEKVLIKYLSISSRNNKTFPESLLEYNEFLINYKLKLENYKISDDAMKAKFDTLEHISKNFSIFDKLYQKIKLIDNAEYLKNFLENIRNCKKDHLSGIETPFLVLLQRSNYLKGKFSRYCGDNLKAIEFFMLSKETHIICDARIIQKSIKQIIKIMKHIDKDIALNSELIIDEMKKKKKVSTQLTIKIQQNKKTQDKILEYIDTLEKDVQNRFSFLPKDLIVLIDFSQTMISNDGKKIKNAIKTAQNIFEVYITKEDRFGLIFKNKSINSVIKLGYKNINTFNYINDIFQNLTINYSNYDYTDESDIITSLIILHNYLNKKSGKKREKWILLITDSFKISRYDELEEILDKFKNSQFYYNIVIIGMGIDVKTANKLSKYLSFNKSCYLKFENISKLKNILKNMGTIQNENTFYNERYNADITG